MPVFLGMIPGLFLGVRLLLALNANVAKIIAGLVLMGVGGVTLLAPKLQLQSRLVLPAGITFGFFGGILGGIAAMPGPLVFIFLLAKGLRGKAFTKEASLYLVISAGLLAILLTASRQFSWLDVSVSTAAMLPVVLGMYLGQGLRDKIAPETFRKLVLMAVIVAGQRRPLASSRTLAPPALFGFAAALFAAAAIIFLAEFLSALVADPFALQTRAGAVSVTLWGISWPANALGTWAPPLGSMAIAVVLASLARRSIGKRAAGKDDSSTEVQP